ncbi:hypothetical protein DIPPA_65284, partial [Diplonema papillatum]
MGEHTPNDIPRIPWPGVAVFSSEYVYPRRPVVISGVGCGRWPAVGKWTPAFFKADIPVQISVSNEETAAPTRKRPDTLAAFVDRLEAGDKHSGYLKQFDEVFDAFPEARADVSPSDLFGPEFYAATYFWMGPAGSRTGLHSDDEHSLLIQVFGQKEVYVLPPEQRPLCYASACAGNARVPS